MYSKQKINALLYYMGKRHTCNFNIQVFGNGCTWVTTPALTRTFSIIVEMLNAIHFRRKLLPSSPETSEETRSLLPKLFRLLLWQRKIPRKRCWCNSTDTHSWWNDKSYTPHGEQRNSRLSGSKGTWFLPDSKFARDDTSQRDGHVPLTDTANVYSLPFAVLRTKMSYILTYLGCYTAEASTADTVSLDLIYTFSTLAVADLAGKWFIRQTYSQKSTSFIKHKGSMPAIYHTLQTNPAPSAVW
jgi:hypothetical protein